MRKKVGIIKRVLCIGLIFLLSINSFAAIVSDNDLVYAPLSSSTEYFAKLTLTNAGTLNQGLAMNYKTIPSNLPTDYEGLTVVLPYAPAVLGSGWGEADNKTSNKCYRLDDYFSGQNYSKEYKQLKFDDISLISNLNGTVETGGGSCF